MAEIKVEVPDDIKEELKKFSSKEISLVVSKLLKEKASKDLTEEIKNDPEMMDAIRDGEEADKKGDSLIDLSLD